MTTKNPHDKARRLQVRIDNELRDRLWHQVIREDTTLTDLVTRAITDYLDNSTNQDATRK